jgi:hypothetical protein
VAVCATFFGICWPTYLIRRIVLKVKVIKDKNQTSYIRKGALISDTTWRKNMDTILSYPQTQIKTIPSPVGLEALVGNTPLLKLRRVTEGLAPQVEVYAKAEWFNPGGSIKDRPALNILRTALDDGLEIWGYPTQPLGLRWAYLSPWQYLPMPARSASPFCAP